MNIGGFDIDHFKDGGKIEGKYRKVCLPRGEVEGGITPGKEYPVFKTRFGKVGMMVCYDGFFPEVARELTRNGAEVIAWPVWGCNPLLARARACENHIYLIPEPIIIGMDLIIRGRTSWGGSSAGTLPAIMWGRSRNW